MPHLADVAHIFRERDNVTLRRRVVENERQIMAREALLVRLVSDGYLRAVLSLIESEKSHGYGGVDLIDDRLEDYMGGQMIWNDPSERCEVIPFLQRLGYDILHFDDDSSCPMSVGWWGRTPSAEDAERYLKNGWTWYPPYPADASARHGT